MDEDVGLLELACSSLGNLIERGIHYAKTKRDQRVARFLAHLCPIHLALMEPQPDYPIPPTSTDIIGLMELVEGVLRPTLSDRRTPSGFPVLQTLQSGRFDSNIGRSMAKNLEDKKYESAVIQSLQRFSDKHFSLASSILRDHEPHAPRNKEGMSNEFSLQAHSALCTTFDRYVYCVCNCSETDNLQNQPNFSGWLQLGDNLPAVHHNEGSRHETIFDTVFMHLPVENRGGHWQHLRVHVPWASETEETNLGDVVVGGGMTSIDPADESVITPESFLECPDFCELLLQNVGPGKIRLRAVSDRLLHLKGFADPDRLLSEGQNMTLSQALQDDTQVLSHSGCIYLAFIIAKSVWQYYDSDFLSAPWMADHIHFLPEREVLSPDTDSNYDPLSPFVKLKLENERRGSPSADIDYADDCSHKYPRILALGIVLVSIFWKPIPVQRHLHVGLLACYQIIKKRSSLDTQPRSVYIWIKAIVETCLNHKAIPGSSHSRKDRQNWLLHNVVNPLKNLADKDMFDKGNACWEARFTGDVKVPLIAKKDSSSVEHLVLLNDDTGATENVSTAHANAATEWVNALNPLRSMLPEVSTSPIKVAILDTGLAFDQEITELYRDRYEAYCFMEDTDHPVISNEDRDGHGTHIASIVLKIGTNCRVYAGRIASVRKEVRSESSSEVMAERISKAIFYAVDIWRVDIISMSFGFKNKSLAVEKAIKYAYDKNVLVLAAAGNSGNLEGSKYPARDPHVLCIRAATGSGETYYGNPTNTLGDPCFAILGVAVEGWRCANKDNKSDTKSQMVRRSGTSQATAVGAGLAALILQLMVDSRLEAETLVSPHAYKSALPMLRQLHGMRKVFEMMCDPNARTFFPIVEPWRLLQGQQSTRVNSRLSLLCQKIVTCLDIPPERKF